MNPKLTAFSRYYLAALRKCRRQPPPPNHSSHLSRASLEMAQKLGRKAVTIGLETLDLARIHEAAFVRSARRTNGQPTDDRNGIRARHFFAEAVKSIENRHLALRAVTAPLQRLKNIHRRTASLASSNRALKNEIVQCKKAEASLRQTGATQTRLLHKSDQLQGPLRRTTRSLLKAQEAGRKEMSRGLRDELLQTLLGVNARLLSLGSETSLESESFQKEIASTQSFVARSIEYLAHLAIDFKRHS